jgi:hypothetical protein
MVAAEMIRVSRMIRVPARFDQLQVCDTVKSSVSVFS